MVSDVNDLAIEHVTHRFGAILAVADAELSVGAGEVVCLVGPSGCGKTTLLRVAAGLETLQEGRVTIGGAVIADTRTTIPPENRNIGIVFQDYALFPHLTVRGNIAFGLQKYNTTECDRMVAQALERTGMSGYAAAYPHQLSGGQQQRVALARAIAPRPRVVLLDEPFSGLDTSLRHRVRDQTAGILRDSGIATLMVTHDPEEAMYLADRIAVMNRGRIRQVGSPDEIYLKPADAFVAAFFGDVNRFQGVVENGHVHTALGILATNRAVHGQKVDVLVRPEALKIAENPGSANGTVSSARFLGRSSLIDVRLSDGKAIKVRVHVPGRYLPKPGEQVSVTWNKSNVFVFAGSADA